MRTTESKGAEAVTSGAAPDAAPLVTIVHRIDQLHLGAGEVYAYAGIDEVGVDSIAGPMLAAAVVLRPEHGVDGLPRDSKKFEPDAIQTMAISIEPAVRFAWIGSLDADAVDQLGVHEARATLWQAAAAAVREALPAVPIIVDGGEPIPGVDNQTAIPAADDTHNAVSAAAILAKAHCDRIMIAFGAEHPGYLFGKHKGYATRDHLLALLRLGPSPVHRHQITRRAMAKGVPKEELDLLLAELQAMLAEVAPLLDARPDLADDWSLRFLRQQFAKVVTRGVLPSGRQQFFIMRNCKRIMKTARKKGFAPPVVVEAPPPRDPGFIARNGPCPCGSGKKYKRCCAPPPATPEG